MGMRKKKGEAGEATKYVTRNKACKMLQLGLPEFRRLCILKGIYPREPKSRTKAQKGDSQIKTLYLKRDIIYVSHEPIIWKFREEKIHRRKLTTLRTKRYNREAKFKQNYQRPTYKLDHIVLERYPSFDKALEDLDDALSAMFLYAALPNNPGIDPKLVHLSRKLTTEFLNYVIESRSLTKTFISIRGYFYRAHIMGEKVTWMIPHPFPPQGSINVEMRIMRIFVEFYSTLLGFVNFKLYQSLNMYYPPKLAVKVEREASTSLQETIVNVIESLSINLRRDARDDDCDDDYDKALMSKKMDRKLKMAQDEREKIKKQQNLFNNVKFYLGRETNRESLTLVIRAAGGLVSWDESLGPGHTYPEDEGTISYQIVDRPTVKKKHMSRYYVQPQWVYDSFNAGLLVSVQNYFVGVDLPAHLSPFEEAHHKLYNPPEMERLRALQDKIDIVGDKSIEELKQAIALEAEEEEEEEIVMAAKEEEEEEEEEEEMVIAATEEEEKEEPQKQDDDVEEAGMAVFEDVEDDDDDPLAKMKVREGRPQKVRTEHLQRLKELEDFRLAASLIHRKQKRFFKKILSKEKKSKKYSNDLQRKRVVYEREMQNRRKARMQQEAASRNRQSK